MSDLERRTWVAAAAAVSSFETRRTTDSLLLVVRRHDLLLANYDDDDVIGSRRHDTRCHDMTSRDDADRVENVSLPTAWPAKAAARRLPGRPALRHRRVNAPLSGLERRNGFVRACRRKSEARVDDLTDR